jgi:hypothetical protein
MTDENGRDLIPLTAGEARRLFNLHTRSPIRTSITCADQAGGDTARQPPAGRITPAGQDASGHL